MDLEMLIDKIDFSQTKVRKRFKHLNFLGEEWWNRFTKSNAIYKWAYVDDLI